jgi:hypothetical protein
LWSLGPLLLSVKVPSKNPEDGCPLEIENLPKFNKVTAPNLSAAKLAHPARFVLPALNIPLRIFLENFEVASRSELRLLL